MDYNCIKEVVGFTANVVTILGVLGLFTAYFGWVHSRKSFHHTVIVNCASRFQKLADNLANSEKKLTPKKARQYLELCSEELFYFENGYLPRPVVLEWLDGMIASIPLRQQGASWKQLLPREAYLNAPNEGRPAPFFDDLLLWQMIEQYPRLEYVFTIDATAAQAIKAASESGEKSAKTAAMLKAVSQNIENYKKEYAFRHLLRRSILSWR